MDSAEYLRLTEAKRAAAALQDASKRRTRQRIASALLKNPTDSIRVAYENLENQRASWQQWSRKEWSELLRSKPVEELANMLVNPSGAHQSELSDSHPFAGISAAYR